MAAHGAGLPEAEPDAKPHSGRGGRRTPRLSEAGSAAGQAEDSEDALALARSLFDVKARTRFPRMSGHVKRVLCL